MSEIEAPATRPLYLQRRCSAEKCVYKKESIPVGCVPPASVTISVTRRGYTPAPGIPHWYTHSHPCIPTHPWKEMGTRHTPPWEGPWTRHTHPHPPVDRMADTCENITFPQLLYPPLNIPPGIPNPPWYNHPPPRCTPQKGPLIKHTHPLEVTYD